jgi:molecular chaperone GrpE
VTDERATIDDEQIKNTGREDHDEGKAGASGAEVVEGEIVEEEIKTDASEASEAPVSEVVEGEIVDEGMDDILSEMEVTKQEMQAIVDELAVLREDLDAARTQSEQYLDDLRRERAAFQNYKKRQQAEQVEMRQVAAAGVLTQILPILDDLERALGAIPEDETEQPWAQGIHLIQRKLHTTLESVGLVPITAEPGDPFDPFVHEAVTYEEHEGFDEGQIIAVVQKGYKLSERTLRPAMVRVAR